MKINKIPYWYYLTYFKYSNNNVRGSCVENIFIRITHRTEIYGELKDFGQKFEWRDYYDL